MFPVDDKFITVRGYVYDIPQENEEKYTYDINVNYKCAEKFKVSLVNKVNNHEQIILKNDEGVYVKTQKSTKQKLNVI